MSKDLIFIDIETDEPDPKVFADLGQLAITEIKAICTYDEIADPDLHSWEVHPAPPGIIGWRGIRGEFTIIGHNIIRFDAPILKRIAGVDLSLSKIRDTLIMAKIIMPEWEAYGLDAIAPILGMTKLDMSDLDARCKRDVEITKKLYEFLREKQAKKKIPEAVLDLEHRVAQLLTEQHEHGFKFDKERAETLVKWIDSLMEGIQETITAAIPAVPIPASKLHYPPKVQFKKDGYPNESIQKYCAKYKYALEVTMGPTPKWCAVAPGHSLSLPLTHPLVASKEIDLNSVQEVKDYLLSVGWRPTMWNRVKDKTTGKWRKTSPKLFDDQKNLCPNIVKLKIPGAERIHEFLTLRNRRNVIKSENGTGWLNNTRLAIDGKLCADADTLGADTHRFTHKIIANVPRTKSYLGKEVRSLFVPSDGKVMVGWDAAMLEACMEAHYTHRYDGGKYAKLLTEGDVHEYNQVRLGLSSRDEAKTFKYAVTYGARPKKLAKTFGWSDSIAQLVYDEFWAANPALAQLVRDVTAASERGYIIGLDGRHIPVDSPHKALNRLLQSGGAIAMKYAMVIADRLIERECLKDHGAAALIRYHDEEQWECESGIAERVGKIGVHSITMAGKYLNLKVPLRGEFKVGLNWSQTH